MNSSEMQPSCRERDRSASALSTPRRHTTNITSPFPSCTRPTPRIVRAIDLAQAPLKSKEVNPDKLKKWSEVSKAPLFDAMGTMSLKEAAEFQMATTTTPIASQPEQEIPTAFGNAFMYLRSAVRMIGGNWDAGSKLAVVEDEGRTYGFTMRVVDVYALTDDIPVFVVVYEHGPGSVSSRPSATDVLGGDNAVHVKVPFLAQKLLLKVLQMNAKHLPTAYAPPLPANEHEHELSFLLPIEPLSMREMGNLASDVGCTVCGQPTASRCAACQRASYCSKECQKADWPTHKLTVCKGKALADGTWLDVDISTSGYPGMFSQSISAFSTLKSLGEEGKAKKGEPKMRSDADGPQENIHGDAPFVIKIQVPAPGTIRPPIMIYDRRRSVEFFLRIEIDRKGYEALEANARRTGYLGQKIYRYAKRTGHSKLSICIDREPPAEAIKW